MSFRGLSPDNPEYEHVSKRAFTKPPYIWADTEGEAEEAVEFSGIRVCYYPFGAIWCAAPKGSRTKDIYYLMRTATRMDQADEIRSFKDPDRPDDAWVRLY